MLALAAGSVIAGHVNDSGFWLVGRFFEHGRQDHAEDLDGACRRTIGLVGFALSGVLFLVA